MHGFEPVTLAWRDQSFTVPANRQLMLIAKIEDALAGESGEQATTVLFRSGGPPHSRLAQAFGAALRYAGATVTDDEIYLSIHDDIANKPQKQVAAMMLTMLLSLLAIISPPSVRAMSAKTEEPTAKNP